MSFSPYRSKQLQEIIFSRKTKKVSHPSLCISNIIVSQTQYQKHLGKKFARKFSRLMTMYKSFVRLHLGYGDIIYDKAYNETFH